MSNNAPDYNDNLVFPPRHDKTAYELQIENSKLKEQLAEHKENCCCAKNEVLLLEINQLKTVLKNLKQLMLDPDCVSDKGDIFLMVRIIDKALNGESEEK